MIKQAMGSLIKQIHDSDWQLVVALSGGGSGFLSELLQVPGASRTVLDASVPYGLQALIDLVGSQPKQACSRETAICMAMWALDRASTLSFDNTVLLGVGITCSIVSDRPKQGDHRCHIAIVSGTVVRLTSIELEKGLRHRSEEEQVVVQAAMLSLAEACEIRTSNVQCVLGPNDLLTREVVHRDDGVAPLLDGRVNRLTVVPDGQCFQGAPIPGAVLPGSFCPLHAAHVALAEIAEELIGQLVCFEISLTNVDKPPLCAFELRQRLDQFAWHGTVELSRAATFLEKSRLLKGTTFVVGVDTAERIVDPQYYRQNRAKMLSALGEIAKNGCHFLVAGRKNAFGHFIMTSDIPELQEFGTLFESIPESRFRIDLSSTQLRQSKADGI